jgi:hypothetical protein
MLWTVERQMPLLSETLREQVGKPFRQSLMGGGTPFSTRRFAKALASPCREKTALPHHGTGSS